MFMLSKLIYDNDKPFENMLMVKRKAENQNFDYNKFGRWERENEEKKK